MYLCLWAVGPRHVTHFCSKSSCGLSEPQPPCFVRLTRARNDDEAMKIVMIEMGATMTSYVQVVVEEFGR